MSHRKTLTIDDIARKAKVSKSTVSRVLNNSSPVKESKRLAVIRTMEQLDYRPNAFARGLAGGLSMTIGIVTQNIGSPFYDSVTQGILRGLARSDYSPIFADGQWIPDVERSAIKTLIGRQVDGIILVGGNLDLAELDEVRKATPAMVVARHLEGWGAQCIAFDNRAAARKAVMHLIGAGHRSIAHIRGIKTHEDARARFEGYRLALDEAGIPFDAELVANGNFNGQSGVLAVESLIARGASFTAIFAANDEMAFGARLALFRRGIRVPDDVSIVGFDDQPNSLYMTPPLTTVRQPAVAMGEAAANGLLDLLQSRDLKPIDLPIELAIRESVAFRR
jgi:LacI family transcriptional regulator